MLAATPIMLSIVFGFLMHRLMQEIVEHFVVGNFVGLKKLMVLDVAEEWRVFAVTVVHRFVDRLHPAVSLSDVRRHDGILNEHLVLQLVDVITNHDVTLK